MWDEATDIESIEYQDSDPIALVVIVPSLSDWQHIIEDLWYRIPVKHAPKRVQVEYLAFYHPHVFEEWQYSIRYLAHVREIRLFSRRQLLPAEPDHPRAEEKYYRFELEELRELPHVIKATNLRRITFIPTKLSLLLQSKEILQLWDKETAIDRLKRALEIREMPCTLNYTIQDIEPHLRVDIAIHCHRGGVGILCQPASNPPHQHLARWDVLAFTPRCILREPDICVDTIIHHVSHKI